MPRNYQHKCEYEMPRYIFYQMKSIVADYDRMLAEWKENEYDIILNTPLNDGQPKGNETSDPTQSKAIKLMRLNDKIEAVDQACIQMVGEYSPIIETFKPLKAFGNFVYFEQTLHYSKRSWIRYRQKLLYLIAKRLGEI